MAKRTHDKVLTDAKRSNPCGECSYPICDCPWLQNGADVPGWIAEDDTLYGWGNNTVHTKRIIYCPLYKPPKKRKVIQAY